MPIFSPSLQTTESGSMPQLPTTGQLAVDIIEVSDALLIIAPVAGAEEKTLDVTVDGDTLTIRGRRERPDVGEAERIFVSECFWGDFTRSVILPQPTEPAKVSASLSKSGILTVRVPKAKIVSAKKVPIRMSNGK